MIASGENKFTGVIRKKWNGENKIKYDKEDDINWGHPVYK